METLEDWLQSNTGYLPSIVQKWSEKIIELGASWDTFSGNSEATLDDLVDGGIPRLSARDICRVMSEVVQRRSRPLMVLWDIENVAIPTQTSAAHAVSQIKAAVEPYGQVKQFRAYASVSLGQIPEEKRSELHLSGCNLVDSPHLGRKEVADKMIIVDAMEFAYLHLDGATLCFITGDVDYAYLLSKLQKPQWTTIVISKGSGETMLHVNCDVKLRWETDILHQSLPQVVFEGSTMRPPPGLNITPANQSEGEEIAPDDAVGEKDKLHVTSSDTTTTLSSLSRPRPLLVEENNILTLIRGSGGEISLSVLKQRYEQTFGVKLQCPNGFFKDWIDSSNTIGTMESRSLTNNDHIAFEKLPRSLHVGSSSDIGTSEMSHAEKENVLKLIRKSVNGEISLSNLRLIYERAYGVALQCPKRSFRDWLETSGTIGTLSSGSDWVAYEIGTRHTSKLMQVNQKAPLSVNELPQKVLEVSKSLKFIIFVKKMHVPKGSDISGVFIKSTETHILLMFKALKEARGLASQLPWLFQYGILVDWQTCVKPGSQLHSSNNHGQLQLRVIETIKCTMCNLLIPKEDIFIDGDSSDDHLCCSCFSLSKGWTETKQQKAHEKVVSLLTTMSEFDDVVVPHHVARKVLLEQYHPSLCASRSQANLWIESTIEAGLIIEANHIQNKKTKVLMLPKHKSFAELALPRELDTSEEENYVSNLLWENNGVIDRKTVIDGLRGKFPRMVHPLMRSLVMRNASTKKTFFVAKGPSCQMVALIYEDALAAIKLASSADKLASSNELPTAEIISSSSSCSANSDE